MATKRTNPKRRTRVLFAAGNGDVSGTLRSWARQQSDLRVMSHAYSAQVYDLAVINDWRLYSIPNHPCKPAHHHQICVIPFQKPASRGARFFINEFLYGRALADTAARIGADLIIMSTGMHPLGYLGAATRRTPVVLTLHNTFWTRATTPPTGPIHLVARTAARLARRKIHAAVCVSEEIKRQAVSIGLVSEENASVFIPQYDLADLEWTDTSDSLPRCILFAGRLEDSKGVADLLQAARILEEKQPGRFHWRFAGEGGFSNRARSLAAELDLIKVATFLGQLDRPALAQEIENCFLTATPTRISFPEGLAKLPLEGAACGKPALLSTAVPALDLLGDAAEPVPPSDPAAIADAVQRLDSDPEAYARRVAACKHVRSLVTDKTAGFHALLSKAAEKALHIRGNLS